VAARNDTVFAVKITDNRGACNTSFLSCNTGDGFQFSFPGKRGGTFDKSYLAPGLIGMSVLFASLMGGVSIIWDREFGFLKEILIAPVSRFFVSLGKAIGGVTTAMIQGILIMIIARLIGIHYVSFWGVLAGIGIMFISGIGFIGLGIAIASRIESHEGFQMVMSFLTMPLVLLTGHFSDRQPSWLAKGARICKSPDICG